MTIIYPQPFQTDPASDGNPREPAGALEAAENSEWQLAELVDTIAAEIDRVEDTLSLKSYARGIAFAIKQLSLDLEVTVRRTPDGRILFRTVEPNQTGATTLKLDFAQVLQSQLQGLRKPLDLPTDPRDLAMLPGITAEQILRLNAIAIYSVDDLERYTQTAAMIAEVSRKTGIADAQIRAWRRLPFLAEIKPASGPPGSTVVIEGGNFGATPDANAMVLFAGHAATIKAWSAARLTVTMPAVSGSGVVLAVVDGQMTNTVPWEATTVDLVVRDISISPTMPVEGDLITLEADLLNQGGSTSAPFTVEWIVDDNRQQPQPHGPLLPGQRSQERSTRQQIQLAAGKHMLRFTADPAETLPDVNRANSTFVKEIVVAPAQHLVIGDFRKIDALDPVQHQDFGPAGVLSLIFRGLGRLDPETGKLVPDIAEKWQISRRLSDDLRRRTAFVVTFHLRDGVCFHDGTALTAQDVRFTYEYAAKAQHSAWRRQIAAITNIEIVDDRTLACTLQPGTDLDEAMRLFTLGIVPQHRIDLEPGRRISKPIGSGPFQVAEFTLGETIQLEAFHDYVEGAPRLNRITILIAGEEQILVMAKEQTIQAAALPERFREHIERIDGWQILHVEENGDSLVYAQLQRLFERQPNSYDTNWNAHLWYVDADR